MSLVARLVLLGGLLPVCLAAGNSASIRAQGKAFEPLSPPLAPRDAAVAKALAAKTDIEALNVPLEDFVKRLAKDHGVTIELDASGLRRAKVDAAVPITASFKQVPLGVALRQVLRPLKLQHHVAAGKIVIDAITVDPQKALPQVARQRLGVRGAVLRNGANGVVMQFNNGQGILQPLRQILQVELAFVKAVCAPTPEQMQRIKQDGLKHIADAAADAQQGRNPQLQNQARHVVQEKVSDLVHTHLSAAQAANYDREISKRTANVRQVCAQNLVVALDEQLVLTEWQRQKLTAELSESWDDSWTTTVVFTATQMTEVLPNVPDELVVPYLDATQRGLWSSIQKRGMIFWGIENSAFLGMDAPTLDNGE